MLLCTIAVASPADGSETIHASGEDLSQSIRDLGNTDSDREITILLNDEIKYYLDYNPEKHDSTGSLPENYGFYGKTLIIDGDSDGDGVKAEVTIHGYQEINSNNQKDRTIVVKNIQFKTEKQDNNRCVFGLNHFNNVTFENCDSDGVAFMLCCENTPGSSITAKKCNMVLENSDKSSPGYYALTLKGTTLLAQDVSVSGYDRGINLEMSTGSNLLTSAVAENCKVSGTAEDKKALQFANGNIGYTAIARNCIFNDCGNAISINEGLTEGTVFSIGNLFSKCDSDFLYSASGTSISTAKIVSAGDRFDSEMVVSVENNGTPPADSVEKINWYTPGKPMTIRNGNELKQFAELVNSGIDFKGETVTLETEIELSGEWTPIGMGMISSGSITTDSTPFRGTFNGNGNTIRGLEIKSTTYIDDQPVGLFGTIDGGTVTNLTLSDFDIEGGILVGTIAGALCNGGSVSDCIVGTSEDQSIISVSNDVGGVVGKLYKDGTITRCYNYVDVSSTNGKAGGIVSAAYYAPELNGMTIKNCHNYGDITCTNGGYTGGIAGLSSSDIEGCTNHGAIKSNGESTGGIVGEQKNAGSIIECTNYGTVASENTTINEKNYGMGGIVGWIRYPGDGNFSEKIEHIVVDGCENEANVTFNGTGVGGIVGMAYHGITVQNCRVGTESSVVIKGTNMVGGIVGGTQQHENQPHPKEGCFVRIIGNSCTCTIDATGDEGSKGGIIGHLTSESSNDTCYSPNNSFSTVINNTINVEGVDKDVFGGGDTVATIEFNGILYGYPKLQTAINNADDESIVTLMKNIDESVIINISKTITLDLNGHFINYNGSIPYNQGGDETIDIRNGTLTITDSQPWSLNVNPDDRYSVAYEGNGAITYNGEGRAIKISGHNAHLIVEGGKIVSEGGDGIYITADVSGSSSGWNCSVTINEGYIRSTEYGIGVSGNRAVLNFNGGVVEATDNSAIAGNGTVNDDDDRGNTEINISGGYALGFMGDTNRDEGYVANAIYHPQSGILNISGDAIIYADNGPGVVIRSGTLNMIGGTIIATGNYSGTVGDASSTVPPYGIVADYSSDYPGGMEPPITISGGNVMSDTGALLLLSTEHEDNAFEVSGGSFSSNVSEFCADGFTASLNPNGTYGVVKKTGVDITTDGNNGTIPTDGDSYILTSDGKHNATITIEFPDGSLTITGSFEDASYTVSLSAEDSGFPEYDYCFEIDTPGIIIDEIMVEFDASRNGYKIDSVNAFYVESDGSLSNLEAGFDGETVWFLTSCNSQYVVDVIYEAISTGPDYPPLDDDDEYIPPIYVPEQPSDDDTVKIIACAAAAVVAALIAAYLIIDRKH